MIKQLNPCDSLAAAVILVPLLLLFRIFASVLVMRRVSFQIAKVSIHGSFSPLKRKKVRRSIAIKIREFLIHVYIGNPFFVCAYSG